MSSSVQQTLTYRAQSERETVLLLRRVASEPLPPPSPLLPAAAPCAALSTGAPARAAGATSGGGAVQSQEGRVGKAQASEAGGRVEAVVAEVRARPAQARGRVRLLGHGAGQGRLARAKKMSLGMAKYLIKHCVS